MVQRLVCDPSGERRKRRVIYVHGSAGSGKTTYAKSLGNDLAYLDSWSIPLSAADKKIIVFDDNCLATNFNMTELIGLTGNVPYRVVSETGHGAPLKAETIVIISQHPPNRFMTGWLIPKEQINLLRNNVDEIVDVDALKTQQVEDLQRRILQLKKQHDELYKLHGASESVKENIKEALDNRDASTVSSSATISSTQETTSAAAKTSPAATLCGQQADTPKHRTLMLKDCLQEKINTIRNSVKWIGLTKDRQHKFEHMKDSSQVIADFAKVLKTPSDQSAARDLGWIEGTAFAILFAMQTLGNENVCKVREGFILYLESRVLNCAKCLIDFFETEITSLSKSEMTTQTKEVTSSPTAEINTQNKAAGVTVTKATTAAKEALPIPKPPQAGLATARSKDDLIEQIKEAISGMVIDAKILVASK